VLLLSASEKPRAVRAAMRAGALGYALKNEQTRAIRAAIREVAAGRAWISARLAFIFATDDDADRPALSQQERRALQLYATGMPGVTARQQLTACRRRRLPGTECNPGCYTTTYRTQFRSARASQLEIPSRV